MNVTEVRVYLFPDPRHKLLGFAKVILDGCLALHDLKIVSGGKGPFVCMPTRKIRDRCRCGVGNPLMSDFCSRCGRDLPRDRRFCKECGGKGCERCRGSGKAKLFEDTAHPVTQEFRILLTEAILKEYYLELNRNGVVVPTITDEHEDHCLYD